MPFNKKIHSVQIDFFNFCNAKCWFCPVSYDPVSKSDLKEMPLELVEKIFFEIDKERKDLNGIISNKFKTCFTAHYSEVLLYRHFKEMLDLARKYNLQIAVLSNGVNLTKDKIDILKSYKDVVKAVGLNIPCFEKELWVKRTGFRPEQFDLLMKNLELADLELSYLGKYLIIGVNGINSLSGTQPSEEFISGYDLDPESGEWIRQYNIACSLFKNFKVTKDVLIHDRAGKIKNIITHQLNGKQKVVGCDLNGDRMTEWLTISPSGDLFLCCNDYKMEYSFGSLQKSTLKEIWNSETHNKVKELAQKEICVNCAAAIKE